MTPLLYRFFSLSPPSPAEKQFLNHDCQKTDNKQTEYYTDTCAHNDHPFQ